MRMLDTAFADFGLDLKRYPGGYLDEIDQVIYTSRSPTASVAQGCRIQATDERAVGDLFEARPLGGRPRRTAAPLYEVLTEADVCLFTTHIRFDSIYDPLFESNPRRIVDYPNLWNHPSNWPSSPISDRRWTGVRQSSLLPCGIRIATPPAPSRSVRTTI